jgi:CzcA family heavy metal efflux pump
VLNAVIRFALRYRMVVVVLSLVLLGHGTYLATSLPLDIFPDLDRPRVVILAECPGLASEEVEALVTQPIEVVLLGANGVQAVRSQSTASLTVIYVEFDWSTDIRAARQTVQERLATVAGVLPEGIHPQMAPTASIMGQIVVAGMYIQEGPQGGQLAPVGRTGLMAELLRGGAGGVWVWEVTDRHHPETWHPVRAEHTELAAPGKEGERRATLTVSGQRHEVAFATAAQQQMELRTAADWVMRPRLLKIPGVAEIFALGGERKQYQVLVDPPALLEFGVTLQQVEQALKENNVNNSGGFAIQGETERPIRFLGRLGPEPDRVLDALRKVPVKPTPAPLPLSPRVERGRGEGRTVLLEQVARVVEGAQLKRGDGSVNGRPGVVLTIVKQPHVDTRALTDRITATLVETEAQMTPDVVVNPELFRLKHFIDRGIYNVGEALVIGALLVLVVLFVFLLNFRTTFITLTAIPLSLVVTTLIFRLIGWVTGTQMSINVMTLGGIAVAMGELVDDAIVDVENIFRRLKVNNALPHPRPALRVVYEASKEIRRAIVFGTVVVILVFLPLFALSGVEGRLFTPLGVAYITSILASLLVSLTVTPVLSYYLLPESKATQREGDGPLLRLLKWLARPLIRLSMARAGWLLLLTWVAVGLCVWELTRLGRDFLPKFDEGSVQVNVTLPPGSSLEASNLVSGILDARFRQMQVSPKNPTGEIVHFVRRTGRAELDEHAAPVNTGEYLLSINPHSGRSREDVINQLLEDLKVEVPGVDIEAEQPLAHLISHMLSGVSAQIAIKVYGDDLNKLRVQAERVKAILLTVPGVTPPIVEPIQSVEEIHIRPRPDDLALHGVSRAYVGNFVQTALQGEVVSQVLDGQRRFDLLVRLEDAYRTDYSQLGRLRIDLPGNHGQVELKALADVGEGAGPNGVNRENARRRIVIRCNSKGRDLAGVVTDIKARVRAAGGLPEEPEYGGQFESQERATTVITALALVAGGGIFVVLMVLYPSVRIVLQILNALPTAFIGGVLALALTGQTLTVASMVGFISLAGIAVRNGILLVTHYFHLMKYEGEGFTRQMVIRGSLERLAPVLMTALTAGIGLVPLVLGGQQQGREILYPVATVILGGLITSTFCEFLIHPGLFWNFSGKDAEKLAKAEHMAEEGLTDQPE